MRYGDVTFALGGRQYTVRFGNLAWDAIYRATNLSEPHAVIARILAGDVGVRDVLLREGLASYHPEITVEQARELYDQILVDGERSLWSATWEALSMSLPKLVAAIEGAIEKSRSLPDAPPPPAPPTSVPRTRRSAKKR